MYIDFDESPTVQEELAQAQIKNLRTAQEKLDEIKRIIEAAATAGTNGTGEAAVSINEVCSGAKGELDGIIGNLSSLAAYMQNALAYYEKLDREAREYLAAKAAAAAAGIGGEGMSF